jgi:hypothetical protein
MFDSEQTASTRQGQAREALRSHPFNGVAMHIRTTITATTAAAAVPIAGGCAVGLE